MAGPIQQSLITWLVPDCGSAVAMFPLGYSLSGLGSKEGQAPALSFVTCENGHSEGRDLICSCHFDFHPPVVIRDVENLLLLQHESFFSLFSLKHVRKIYLL